MCVCFCVCFFFFFSSRRRHTRFDCDWSSDVCSSDLIDPDEYDPAAFEGFSATAAGFKVANARALMWFCQLAYETHRIATVQAVYRSEERRVGKECRARWGAEQ